jgi:hypothetical protein
MAEKSESTTVIQKQDQPEIDLQVIDQEELTLENVGEAHPGLEVGEVRVLEGGDHGPGVEEGTRLENLF